jgi:glucan phosphoethanolaminetransferase (alkaline phosphatase superfamily)
LRFGEDALGLNRATKPHEGAVLLSDVVCFTIFIVGVGTLLLLFLVLLRPPRWIQESLVEKVSFTVVFAIALFIVVSFFVFLFILPWLGLLQVGPPRLFLRSLPA